MNKDVEATIRPENEFVGYDIYFIELIVNAKHSRNGVVIALCGNVVSPRKRDDLHHTACFQHIFFVDLAMDGRLRHAVRSVVEGLWKAPSLAWLSREELVSIPFRLGDVEAVTGIGETSPCLGRDRDDQHLRRESGVLRDGGGSAGGV